jgi:hypothetical protein
VDAGRGERRERPDQVVGDEDVRARRPALDVAVVVLEIAHPARGRMPLRELGRAGVVERQEARPPGGEFQSGDVIAELVDAHADADDAFPSHGFLLE